MSLCGRGSVTAPVQHLKPPMVGAQVARGHMRAGLSLSLSILRGKARSLATWAGGSARAVADGLVLLRELGDGRVGEIAADAAEEFPIPSVELRERWAKLAAEWSDASPAERGRQVDGLIGMLSGWLAIIDAAPARSGGAQRPALPPVEASQRALFLRGGHAQAYGPDGVPVTSIGGRRLAAWCLERANGVKPDLRVGGVTYWFSMSDGKARAFCRHWRVVRGPDGAKRRVECWRGISAPTLRQLKMRLASKAGVCVDAVETWPAFVDEAKS